MRYKLPSYIAIGVFVVCMLALFIPEFGSMNKVIFATTLGYGFVCILFLGFQLWAFIKAHSEYDESTEQVKYRVFEAEGISLNEVEKDY
ncbi:MAG: hypothetical protein ACO20H_09585 [Bacteriovoracaceae bacterium]